MMKRHILAAACCFLLSVGLRAISVPPQDDAQSRLLLDQGRANDAIAALKERLAAAPGDALAHNLLCRVYYQEERWDNAANECQAAVQMAPGNSGFHDWMGRVYGEQAQRASLLKAYSLAKKVHAEFIAAIQADPKNVLALADMGEYDADTPGFLGGGLDKARSMAAQLAPLSASHAHALLAVIAQKEHDKTAAERELRQAIAQSQRPAGRWMDLASFFGKQGDLSAMERAIQSGLAADADHSSALVDGASILLRYKQNFPLAEQMLRLYLASGHLSEDAPSFRVHAQLGHLLALEGNTAAAQKETALAHALASGWAVRP